MNTGRFVGSRSKSSSGRLEDTITKNNLEAVKEVVRQLRLRDIGGIIVIDFIDMANPKNRETVEEALRTELERDRTKTYVVEISPLGLVEMTRQNVTDGPREILTRVPGLRRRRHRRLRGDGCARGRAAAAHARDGLAGAGVQGRGATPKSLSLLLGPGGARLAEIEEAAKKRFFLVAEGGRPRRPRRASSAEGKLVDLQPPSADRRGRRGRAEARRGRTSTTPAPRVGKLDGVDVVVGGAAKLVGKKAKVRVERVLDGVAYATSLDGVGRRDEPITFESEAEKPTRAPEPGEEADGRGRAETEVEAESRSRREVEPAEVDGRAGGPTTRPRTRRRRRPGTEPKADGDAPAKKKTRRGSRGGRNRKKKPALAARPRRRRSRRRGAGAERSRRTVLRAAPRIHVPDFDLGGRREAGPEALDAEARSGRRGGGRRASPAEQVAGALVEETDGADGARRRRRPVAARAAAATGRSRRRSGTAASDERRRAGAPSSGRAAGEAATNGGEPAADEYVPMSEWLDDLDALASLQSTGSRALPAFPALYEHLRDHLRRRQAVPRPRGRDAARGPARSTVRARRSSPTVLLIGGDGGDRPLAERDASTARVVADVKGDKIRIGKYRPKNGYKKHTGFRASLSQIEIESIGGAKKAAAKKARRRREAKAGGAKAEAPRPPRIASRGCRPATRS